MADLIGADPREIIFTRHVCLTDMQRRHVLQRRNRVEQPRSQGHLPLLQGQEESHHHRSDRWFNTFFIRSSRQSGAQVCAGLVSHAAAGRIRCHIPARAEDGPHRHPGTALLLMDVI